MYTREKHRYFSMLLIIMLALTMLLIPVFASAAANIDVDAPEPAEAFVISEIASKRTETSKTYRMSDGTYKYVAYAEPVHYLDAAGVYHEIDNTLSAYSKDGVQGLKNTANAWSVIFGNSLTDPEAVRITSGNHSIAFSMPGAAAARVIQATELRNVYNINSAAERCGQCYNELAQSSSSAIYTDVYDNTDIAYTVHSCGLKEDIILRKAPDSNEFIFDIRTNGLRAAVDGNTVLFTDAGGNSIFRLASMYALDAAGKRSDDVEYELENNGDFYRLIVRASEDFLYDENTVYPVIIDPTTMVTGTATTYDTCIDEQYPNSNYALAQSMWVGGKYGTNAMRTYIKFDMPFDSSVRVISAELSIKKRDYENPAHLKVFRASEVWDPATITWNTKTAYDMYSISYDAAHYSGAWYRIDVKSIVQKWITQEYPNFGFVLRELEENSQSQKTRFYSSDAPSPNKPELIINYDSAENYIITYHGNGNTGGPSSFTQVVSAGRTTTIKRSLSPSGQALNTMVKAGSCPLLRWNTRSDGTGTDYAFGQTIRPSEDMHLYAVWGAPLYSYREVTMKAWVDQTFVNEYPSDWLEKANSILEKSAYPFYQTFNFRIIYSTPEIMVTSLSQCPNTPDGCTSDLCGNNFSRHHVNGTNVLNYVWQHRDTNYDYNTLLYDSVVRWEDTNSQIINIAGLAYGPDKPCSMALCTDVSETSTEYWGSMRRMQHEWSHNLGAKHNGEQSTGGLYCPTNCINNSGMDNYRYQVPDVWCSRCKLTMQSALNNYIGG